MLAGVRRVAAIAALGLGLAGCQRPNVDLFLPMEEGVASLLVVSKVEDQYRVWAADAGDDTVQTAVLDAYIGRYEVEVTALLYTASLDAMRLTAGDVPLADDGRRLPPPSSGYQTVVRGPDTAPWSTVEGMPDDLATLRIEGLGDFACLAAGGCFDDAGTCSTPCEPVDSPAPPNPVAPPQTEPCPAGMMARVLDEDVVVCELFPTGRDPVCPRGQVHFAGTIGCGPIGPACPTGLYAEDVPAGNRRHVAPGGTGDGSLGSPFGTITEALSGAVRGDVVMVGKGTYTETFDVPDGITIVGACPRDTTIVTGGERIYFFGTSAMQNVRIEDGGLRAEAAPANVRWENIHFFRPRVDAMRASGALTLHIESVYVDGAAADGLAMWDGPEVTARRVVITEANSHGIIVHNARLTLEDSVVEETQPNENGVSRGLGVQGSAVVVVERSQISDGVGMGIFADASDLTLIHSVLRDTSATGPTETDGRALYTQNNANVTVRKSWIHGSRYTNVYVQANVTLEDSVSTSALPQADMQDGGFGAYVGTAGDLTLTRSVILDPAYHGIFGGGRVAFDDLIIRRTGVRASDGRAGRGILTNTQLEGRRLDMLEIAGPAIEAEFGADPRIDDVKITRPGTAGCKACTGICLGDEVPLSAERVSIGGASGAAISQYENLYGAIRLRDVDVRNASATLCDRPVTSPSQGLGDGIRSFGTLDLVGFSVADCNNAGLVVGAADFADTVSVREGTVSGSRVGLSLFAIPENLADVATRVDLSGNTVAVSTDQGS